jgi:predicted DNA-binding WGR domain protein
MPRYECTDGTARTFWTIDLAKSIITTTSGKLGTQGQVSRKKWPTAARAKEEHDKLIAAKLRSGYVLVDGKGGAPPRRPGEPTIDLAKVFTPGAKFKNEHSTYTVKLVALTPVTLPTGKLFACDPFAFHAPQAFERTVKKGTYEVTASVARIQPIKKGRVQERVGAAMVRFARGTPVTWVNATKKGQKLRALEPGSFYGYGVDAGTGCFCDITAAMALRALDEVECANENWEGWLMAKVSRRMLESGQAWGAASAITVPDTKANVVCFSSGWGDGFYASYWGLSKKGDPLCLVTVFGVYPV